MTHYLKQNKLLLFFAGLLSIISSLGYVFIAVLLQQLLDAAAGKNMHEFSAILAFASVYFSLLGIFMYLQSLVCKKIICIIISRIRVRTFQGIINQSIEDFGKNKTAEYISAVTNDIKLIEDNFLLPLFEVFQYTTIFTASLFVMIYFDLIVTIVVIIAIAAMFIVPGLVGSLLENRQTIFSQKLSAFTADLKDIFSGFEIIRSYSMIPYILNRFEKSNTETIRSKYSADKVIALNEGLSAFLALMVQVAVLFLSAYFIIIGRTSVGTLLGMVQVSSNLANPLLMLFTNVPKMKSVKPIIDKLNDFAEYREVNNHENHKALFEISIFAKDLSFSYDGKKDILHNISWQIEKGKKYAIVGKSGCGKSTLIKLLTGCYSTYKGTIFYDGKELKSLDKNAVVQLSSIIHQNVYLFDETIEDNICLHESYPEDRLHEVLEKSGIDEFTAQIPEGVSYKAGEAGSNLSGGQRQRIAVARALIRNKPLLILDEGTSAIDMQTAYDIESRLLKLRDLTMITITHNMKKELLEQYDAIVYMEDGKIAEIGTFHDLIHRASAFSQYYQLKR